MSRREEYNRFSGGGQLPDKDTMTLEEALKWQREDALLKQRQEADRQKRLKKLP